MARGKHYTPQEVEYIRSIAKGRTRQEITDMFNAKFNDNRTLRSIGSQLNRRGIKTKMQGHATQFKNGAKPWNKGMKGLQIGGVDTQFKKGQKSANSKPIGT